MEPITRDEMYLAAAAGEDVSVPEPITREEFYLAAAAGEDVHVPEPVTRRDMYMKALINKGGSGGGGVSSVSPKEVNFYDYDGTCLYAYTVEEAQALTELPPLPVREGLICQEWNWSLEDIKSHNRAVNVGATYTTDDGTTRIYITLHEGRTSPMLGVCPNGTVTVDWGDGTEPDTLTGTSVTSVAWTPNHEYAEPGNYVIRLTVDGSIGIGCMRWAESQNVASILRASSSRSNADYVYQNAVKRIECGNGVTNICPSAFVGNYSLESIVFPNSLTSIGDHAFYQCHSLLFVVIPNGVTDMGSRIFYSCHGLKSVIFPDSLTSIGDYAFYQCHALASITMPDSVTSIGGHFFEYCKSLQSLVLPASATNFGVSALENCWSLASVVIPAGAAGFFSGAFRNCYGVRFFDFTNRTAVPPLSYTNVFEGIPADCEFRVPASLVDEWKAATNWATYADYIVGV